MIDERKVRQMYRVFLALVLLFCPAFSQTPSGSVAGRAADGTGTGVEGVRIQLRNLETNETRAATSSRTGDFAAVEVPIGEYQMVAEKGGFRTVEHPKLEIQVDTTLRINLKMMAGDPAARIVLRGEDIGLVTESADTGDTAGREEIGDTPLQGRDFENLGFQTAGVLKKAAGGAGGNFSINGARADNTNFLLDGFNNRNVKGGGQQIKVPIDAMQEFKMQVSAYSPEYGRYGGGAMNVVLRSGTNELHGTVFEFLRNDALDTRNFFDAEKSKLRRNQFGSTANGPVYLPKLYDGRNRTFFLVSWESYRQVQSSTQLSRVPTALEHAGDFSQSTDAGGVPIFLKDPLATGACNQQNSGGCFPGNIIPKSRWNLISEKVAAYYPLPNNADVNNFRSSKNDADNWDSFMFKVDHRLTPADSIAVRLGRRLADTTNPFAGSPLPGFSEDVKDRETMGGISYSKIIRPSLINDLRLGVVRTANTQTGFNDTTNFVGLFGLPGVSTDPQFWGFPRFTVRDLGALGDPAADPAIFVVNTWQASDTVSWVRAKHSIKFGGEILRSQYTQDANNNLRGTFNFLGRWTNSPFADFLIGGLNNSTRQVGSYRNYLSNNMFGFFIQDEWRVTTNLTVKVGARYEMFYPPADKYGRWTNFVPEIGKQVIASTATLPDYGDLIQAANLVDRITTADAAGYPAAIVYPNTHNVAPRLGIAWRPHGAQHTVIRTGYGVFYTATNMANIRTDLGAAFPFLVKQTFSRNAGQFSKLTLSDPFPDAMKQLTDVTNAFGYELRPHAPYLQSWSFGIEHEIDRNTILEATYTGSKGTHLGRKYDINQPLRSASLTPPFPRPFSGLNTINYYAFGSNSNYNGAMVALRRHFSDGGMLRVNYTLAKSIDENSQLSGAGDGGYGGAQDSRNLWLERGRSDWDVRHAITANANYPLPFFARNRWIGGWRLSGTTLIYSGAPFTPQTSNVQLDQGEANRPDRVAFGTVSNPTPNRWFDVTAFPVVPTGAFRFGNSGRNILNGPGQLNINVGLMKNFAVDERRFFQFRVEAFNVINHANFALPNVNVNAVNGGTITQADPPRLIQAALKFMF